MPNDWADFGPAADAEIETFTAVDEPRDDETATDERPPERRDQDGLVEVPPWSDPAPVRPEEALARVETVLDLVEQALTRLDDGTYGQCGACGSVIDDDQLEAVPTAQACASCTPVGA